MTALENIVQALEAHGCKVLPRAGRHDAQCPAHDDSTPSLSVTAARDYAGVLLHCHAGCAIEQILDALGMQARDLFDEPQDRKAGYTVTATYDYVDENGTLLFVAERRFPKSFRQRRPDGHAGWVWNLKGARRVLFRLPAVVAAVAAGTTVYVCEGERDVHATEQAGAVATCNPMGAGKWAQEFGDVLRGADVVVVQDRDDAGRQHAAQVVADLTGKAASVRLVEAAAGKDAADHLAAGHSLDDLVRVPQSTKSTESALSEPEALPDRPVLAAFPVDALPEWGARYVDDLATATQTPTDLAGTCVLGIFAACVGGRAMVEARAGWREPTNLYLLPVLASASRKSAVVADTAEPLYQVERDLTARVRPKLVEAETLRDIATSTATEAKRKAGKAASEAERRNLSADAVSAAADAEQIVVPIEPQLIADDVTPEAAASLLADHGGRIAIISAEGGLFETMAGRYSKGIPNIEPWLKGHAGDLLKVNRKGRPPEYVRRPALTMLLSVQPSVLAAIARNGEFRGRGLLARFLYTIPVDNVGYRDSDPAPMPPDTAAAYTEHVSELAARMADWTDPAVLTLTLEARALLLDIDRRNEPRLRRDSGDLAGPGLREWAGKLVGATVRLAGLLHLAAGGNEALRTPISRDTLAAADRLGSYFAEHARAAFGLLGDTTGVIDNARYLLDHLRDRAIEECSIRDLHVALPRGRFATADDVTAAVGVLVEYGWLAPLPAPDRPGPGRKSSPRYRTHPRITHGDDTRPRVDDEEVPTQSTESTEPVSSADSVDSVDSVPTSSSSGAHCIGCGESLPDGAEVCGDCYRAGNVA